MKWLLFTLLLLPAASFSQTVKDYEYMMGKFMTFYNAGQADSLTGMYIDTWKDYKDKLWPKAKLDGLMEKYGEMVSYKYIGEDKKDHVQVFKTVFTKSTHATSLSLHKDNKIGTFRFETTSPEIEKLMEMAK